MKVTEFLGRRVVDKKAMEIGKVSDVIIEPKEAVITGIQISTGEFGLRKTDLFVTPAEVDEVGDYILLNVKKSMIRGIKKSDEEEKTSLNL
ncbi:MAG TPA: PRC-barrel domain-containing protein [Methanobacterium sp.]|nr:PRC-barrel domain-containing protein [Methanobacterium sp.]